MSSKSKKFKIVVLSDTHGKHGEITVPKCDLLLHVGDALQKGTIEELMEFAVWFEEQDATYKVYVPGNHDGIFERQSYYAKQVMGLGVDVLIDDVVEIEGIKIYGSPYTREFNDWAFMKKHHELQRHWDKIPDDTDILLTHMPPYGINDIAPYRGQDPVKKLRDPHQGCPLLRETVLNRVRPRLHMYGHIHYGAGKTYEGEHTKFYNVAALNEDYNYIGKIMEIEYDNRRND